MLTIKSLRIGHANNSSSSHSVVFLGDRQVEDSDAYGEFGWNQFTCASKTAKAKYLLATLKRNFESVYFVEKRQLITEKIVLNENNIFYEDTPSYDYERVSEMESEMFVKKEITEHFQYLFDLAETSVEEVFEGYNYYVDHQSIINFPVNYNMIGLNVDFLKQFFKVILEYNFVFLGGNDNGDDTHKLRRFNINNSVSNPIMEIFNLLDVEGNPFNYIALYDENNKDWILQDKSMGNKLRCSFESYENVKPTEKSQYPELVDLKITNYCEYGCKFCYQSSTKKGKHASFENLSNIIDSLSNSKCMEIAIGGGEPTTHPDFIKTLEYINSKNILIGFTTKNFELDNDNNFNEIINITNSIAFSCQNMKEVQRVGEINSKITNGDSDCAIYVQIILELTSPKLLKQILEYCDEQYLNLTILGYKTFGFGKNYKPTKFYDTSDWIDLISHSFINVGVDSIIVKKWKQDLIDKGVNELMLVGEEGKFSCYIDAVENTIAKSSFIDESQELDLSNKNIFKQFYKF